MSTDYNKENGKFYDFEKPCKSQGMKVPDGYFEDFEKSVLAKIKTSSSESETPVIAINSEINYQFIWKAFAVAAALIWGAFWIYSSNVTSNTDDVFAELTIEEWAYYEGVDDYLLAENFTTEELNEIVLIEESDLSADELYEYLLDENISDYTLSFYQSN